MNILETLLSAQGSGSIRKMSQQLGLSEDQTMTALSALMPALAGGFQRNLERQGGIESLAAALGSGRHQQYLDDPSTIGDPSAIADGNGILAHVLGAKEVSRHVASRAAAQTGIGEGVLKQMLPLAAALMMGSLSRQSHNVPASSALGAASSPDFMAMLTPLLDQNRDGSLMDDVTGMLGKFLGGSR